MRHAQQRGALCARFERRILLYQRKIRVRREDDMPAGGSICPKRRTSAQREVPQAAHSLGAAKIAGVSGKVFGAAKYLQKAPCRDAESPHTLS